MPGFVCEITPDCNLACSFCYNTWRAPTAPRPTPLPAQELTALLIRVLQESDADWATFAGGEPLLYPELAEVAAGVHRALPAVKLGIATNGILLNEERLDTLIAAGVGYFELPLFSASESRYHELTGLDALQKVRHAIIRVKARRLPLTAACILLPEGLPDFTDVVRTAFALGADQLALNPFTPTGHSLARAQHFELTRATLRNYLQQADQLSQELRFPIAVTIPLEDCFISHADYPHLQFGRCICGVGKWVIDPCGNLRTCEQNEAILGSLVTSSFAELSQTETVRSFRANNFSISCLTCESLPHCGGGCRFRTATKKTASQPSSI